MARGVAHSPELRAEAVAAVLAGTAMAQVARQYGIDKSVVSRWVASDATGRPTREESLALIEDYLLELIAEHTVTLRAQLQATARPEWIEKQSAADLAELVVAQRDTLIRLLAGFRPAPDPEPPQLDAPRPSDAET